MMNPTSIYVSTCRLVLQAEIEDSSSWLDVHKLFPSLRQSLSCTVCGNLLMEPYTPTESICQHHVCRTCKGGRKKLRPSCSWCKDYSKYVENVQLRTLLQCYKKLCSYVTSSEFYRALVSSNSNNSISIENNRALLELLKEGTGFKDEYKIKTNVMLPMKTSQSSLKCASTQTVSSSLEEDVNKRKTNVIMNGGNNKSDGGESSLTYSVICTNNGNRLTFKRTAKDNHDNERNGEQETNSDKRHKKKRSMYDMPSSTKINKVRKRSIFTKSVVCKCGVGSQNRSSCKGYCCPCYSSNKSCLDCTCLGCKNPITTSKEYPVDRRSESNSNDEPLRGSRNSDPVYLVTTIKEEKK